MLRNYRPGDKLGPYTIVEYIGSGGVKSVYKASRDDSLYALGIPHPHLDNVETLQKLRHEANISSQLVHPGIVRVFGVEEHDGVYILVMEYGGSRTLRDYLKEKGKLEQPEALRYAGLVAEALAYAHEGQVLHRDVKPENIIISEAGRPKLLDFGLARLMAHSFTRVSGYKGTVAYNSPEICNGAAGTNSDIWSLGVVLYEMLTGELPFRGSIEAEIIKKILYEPFDEKPLREAKVSDEAVRLLNRMLAKNPDERYRTADELADDIERVARRLRLYSDDEGRIELLIRAGYPLLYIVSYEETRVLEAIRRICLQLKDKNTGEPRPCLVWSASKGLCDAYGKTLSEQTKGDPSAALNHVIDSEEKAVYVFLDMHRHFTPVISRLVRDAARTVRYSHKSLVFIGPSASMPVDLEKEATVLVYNLPDQQRLEAVVRRVSAAFKPESGEQRLSREDVALLARCAAGMTEAESERAIASAAVYCGSLGAHCAQHIIECKTQVIRKRGVLEYYHDTGSMSDVGGLKALVQWFESRSKAFADTTRYAGLPVPRGVMLLGIPGCGKSLSARALAGAWKVPLLRLDIGRVFGSYVGQSEANMREALQTAETVSPCILWIDEIEKGFAGTGSEAGGVFVRVLGSFLNWMQEKRSPVFVVATANSINGLPPELLRRGRFDEIFFVDLPNEQERKAIFSIHIAKRGRIPAEFDIESLAKNSRGFSGAEIEQAIIDALHIAFDENQRKLTTADILAALKNALPLSQTPIAAETMDVLRRWAKDNARPATEKQKDEEM